MAFSITGASDGTSSTLVSLMASLGLDARARDLVKKAFVGDFAGAEAFLRREVAPLVSGGAITSPSGFCTHKVMVWKNREGRRKGKGTRNRGGVKARERRGRSLRGRGRLEVCGGWPSPREVSTCSEASLSSASSSSASSSSACSKEDGGRLLAMRPLPGQPPLPPPLPPVVDVDYTDLCQGWATPPDPGLLACVPGYML